MWTRRVLICLGLLLVPGGLLLAFAGLLTGMKSGHVYCCHLDMDTREEVAIVVDGLGVDEQRLVDFLVTQGKKPSVASNGVTAEEASESNRFELAVLITPKARELYLKRVKLATKFAIAGGATIFVSGVVMLVGAWRMGRLLRMLGGMTTNEKGTSEVLVPERAI